MMLVILPVLASLSTSANAHLQHIKLAFENPVSHHFAHNDLLLATMPPHLATVSCWVAQCYDTTPVRNSMAKNSMLRINSLAMPVKRGV